MEATESSPKKRKLEESKSSLVDNNNHDDDDKNSDSKSLSEVDNDEAMMDIESPGTSNRTVWTLDEDLKLHEAVGIFKGKSWRKIAEHVGTKTTVQCSSRWENTRPGIVRGQWTLEEDKLLVILMSKGYPSWTQLAEHVPGRHAKQCRERWLYHLDPNINKDPFTNDEDDKIMMLYEELGSKWAEISRQMPGRSASAIKIRHKSINRAKEKGKSLDRIQQRRRQAKP